MSYGNIFIALQEDATLLPYAQWKKNSCVKIVFNKYTIKETDFRVKTATFTTPNPIDLTRGLHQVLIISAYHENFAGQILDVDYDEETQLFTYQCQDWSRAYISKFELMGNNIQKYRLLQYLLTRGYISAFKKPTAKQLKGAKLSLGGLKSVGWYSQNLYKGNLYKGNPFQQTMNVIIRNKSFIETIRAIVYDSLGFFDVWFNDNGILQIEPISKTDWENTGLVLQHDFYNRKVKFATTNIITDVIVNGTDFNVGQKVTSKDTLKIDLSAFFGKNTIAIDNPNKNNNTTNAVKSTKTTTNKTTMKNPFNNKDKRIIVSADGGSGGFKDDIVGMLRNDGWDVNDLGVGPGTHSRSYDILDSKYAVNLTIYNGADPATIAEPITGWLAGAHEKHSVQLVQMFDTSDWTNPDGMKPYRYGDFSGYYCGKAWDDNYSSGFVDISNLGDWYSKYYPKVIHVCGPSPSEAFSQFNAGGYFKSKGLK